MFTGIIEARGIARSFEKKGRVWQLILETPSRFGPIRVGQSVSVNGVCLTAVESKPRRLIFEIQQETLRSSALGLLRPGDRVNLERALAAGGRLDGHFVQGHVDAVGTIQSLRRRGKDQILQVRFPKSLAPYLVPKGSIAVDGISLTVVDVRDSHFMIHLIPHTLRETNLGDRQKGDKLNLEADILGKYITWNLQRQKSDARRKKKIPAPLD